MGILIRLAISALALWISTLILKGITLGGDSVPRKVFTLILVAVIFGLVNAILRPVIKTLGCALYILALVVNGLLLLLTSWIAGKLDLPFHVDKFWPTAVLGALIVGIISWVLNMFVPDGKDNGKDKD